MKNKTYEVNVHYDFYVSVRVQASSEEEALSLARDIADDKPLEEFVCADYIDSCVTNECE